MKPFLVSLTLAAGLSATSRQVIDTLDLLSIFEVGFETNGVAGELPYTDVGPASPFEVSLDIGATSFVTSDRFPITAVLRNTSAQTLTLPWSGTKFDTPPAENRQLFFRVMLWTTTGVRKPVNGVMIYGSSADQTSLKTVPPGASVAFRWLGEWNVTGEFFTLFVKPEGTEFDVCVEASMKVADGGWSRAVASSRTQVLLIPPPQD